MTCGPDTCERAGPRSLQVVTRWFRTAGRNGPGQKEVPRRPCRPWKSSPRLTRPPANPPCRPLHTCAPALGFPFPEDHPSSDIPESSTDKSTDASLITNGRAKAPCLQGKPPLHLQVPKPVGLPILPRSFGETRGCGGCGGGGRVLPSSH